MSRLTWFANIIACGILASAPARADERIESYSAEELQSLRKRAAEMREADSKGPDGWSVGKLDSAGLFSLFKPLRLKKGVVLRAYKFREGGNGNGVVWALPADAEFPPPQQCPKGKFVPELDMPVPRPPSAFASVMAHLDGDGSPWSYLAASLLRRELLEYGALWHGNHWSTHWIVDSDPLQRLEREPPPDSDPMMTPRGNRDEWRWVKSEPRNWKPQVCLERDTVTVTFYTYSGLDRQRIYRHTDRFHAGSYDFESESQEVAVGPGGFLF